jgi:Tfp pilus assembly protein PilF
MDGDSGGMSFFARHVWLATCVLTAAACSAFALLFYPRGVDFDAQLARAAERYDSYALIGEGMSAQFAGDLRKARKKYESAVELDPTLHRAYAVLGQLELQQGHLEAALANLDTAMSMSEQQADVYNNRGVVKWSLGDRRGAMRDFNRALEHDEDFNRALTNRGLARLIAGDLPGAQADFEKSLAGRENLQLVQSGVIGLGIVHALEGRYNQALDSFSVVARNPRPKAAIALYNRAKVYDAMGNAEAARHDREAYEALVQKLESTDGGAAAPDDEA